MVKLTESKSKGWALVGSGLAAFCLSLGVACGHGLRPESVCLFLLGLIVLAFTLGLPIALYGVKKREKYFRPPAFLGFLVMGGLAIASILFTAAMTIGLCEKEAELNALEEGYHSQQAEVEPARHNE
ncbi:MAG: hypothetical protein KC777_09565 [Cyanobacteria bacterium HKST-UBA02]|nr:hypothetical protein [Cyanobacteria bacterium HKST-UBA02]